MSAVPGKAARPRWGDVQRPAAAGAGPVGAQARKAGAPPIRLTRRGRIVLVALIAALSLAVGWLGTRAAVTASAGPSVEGLTSVTVQEGDTLWEIAAANPGEGDPAVRVREIMDLNGLPDPLIRPGTTLYLPRDVPGQ
ncbi:LysM peptidoglycan-binding domain-containing protein [Herbidospora cretacea]|uniref:LysM peptidoglycan-binding domain-containing protein n=1 Tax=Herbidospora cretacea TaxID=28444 RepID=UPI001471CE7C|nr:LysM peptidoglycan-binding domain-containing protein [Herbidospora cretacea]